MVRWDEETGAGGVRERDFALEVDGRLPINTSGGGLVRGGVALRYEHD